MSGNGATTVMLKGIFEQLAEGHQLPKKLAHDLLSGMVDSVTRHLKQGDRIRINGLGTLEVRKREARTGRNPATGETRDRSQQESCLPSRQGVEGNRLKAICEGITEALSRVGTNGLSRKLPHHQVRWDWLPFPHILEKELGARHTTLAK
jgi:nucleoid DNA-binding protein